MMKWPQIIMVTIIKENNMDNVTRHLVRIFLCVIKILDTCLYEKVADSTGHFKIQTLNPVVQDLQQLEQKNMESQRQLSTVRCHEEIFIDVYRF